MSMVIKNNMAAQLALGELNKNNKNLSKSLAKVSSGMRYTSAQDGASEYSISEKMRVRLRGLNQDIVNSQTGANLVRTAEGGIQEIIDNLREMKALAINAANDHNTDVDRQIIQKEQDSRLAVINEIAATTNYNGRLLLNGNLRQPVEDGMVNNIPEPDGPVVMMTTGDYTISQDGVYMMPQNYKGRITINAANVKIVQEHSTDVHYGVAIECTQPGANLWLDDVKITNAGGTTELSEAYGLYDTTGQKNNNIVKFTGTGNHLSIRNEVIIFGGDNGDEKYSIRDYVAIIHVGGGLAIHGVGEDSKLTAVMKDGGSGRNTRAAAIGTDALESSNANLEISGLSYLEAWSEWGAAIGAGVGSSFGNITIKNVDEIRVGTCHGAGVGAGMEASCGNIEISAHKIYGKITTDSNGRGASIGHSTLDRASSGRVAITANYIFLATKTATASKGNFSAGAGSGATIWTDGGATVNGEAFNIDGRSYSSLYTNRNVYEYDDGTVDENGIYHGEEREEEYPGLIIHTGTKANENLRIFINSMDTDTMGISDIQMDPFERALEALSKLDDALEYSLNENTRMGAYQTRLSFVIDNLTVASESTQASESVIRDANMAKEMTIYTKNNVLSQSAQAMLAQANQNSSSVLSLLQG
ncbi:flagellin [Selenomonas sp. WCT3]|nr:flagellin [Selenomonas ruminantium]